MLCLQVHTKSQLIAMQQKHKKMTNISYFWTENTFEFNMVNNTLFTQTIHTFVLSMMVSAKMLL